MMISRSSIKNLTKALFYPMSKKKLTEQWRKPIEQLKQQKQQNTPIPPDADHKKKVAMQFMAEKYGKPEYKLEQDGSIRQPQKKMFKKKGQAGSQPSSVQQSSEARQAQKASQVNWLEMQQFPENKELSQLVNEALKMAKLKYQPELKEVVGKIKEKYHHEGFEHLLNSLLKQNFLQTLDDFKQLQIQPTKLNTKLVNTIIFGLIERQQFTRLTILLNDLKSASYHLDCKEEELFDMLFWKQTSQDVDFEAGENSVNISLHNKVFAQKLSIANLYLEILGQHGKKKNGHKKASILPLWFVKSSKIVLRYRFAFKQFSQLLNQLFIHHEYLVPENFYESQHFCLLLKEFYFGQQQTLPTFLKIVEKQITPKNIKLATFYRNFTNQLMSFRLQNERPAFQVDQTLIECYKKAFEKHQKYLAIICTIVASDAHYKELPEHYVKSYMQGFPNESLSSEDTKFVEEGIVNNYNRFEDAQKHEKGLQRTLKSGANHLTKLKAAIKLNDLQQAYKLFEESILKKVTIERMRKNIEFVLRKQLGFGFTNFIRVKEVTQFVNKLEDEYLWSLHRKTEDVSVMLKKFLPEDKFSFWEEKQKKERFEQISKHIATGQIDKIKQPQSDVEATGFDLNQYLQTQFPHLKQLETQQYEKQKQLIKYTLNVEGLIFWHKVHNDALIIEKLNEIQAQLGEENLELIESFGLKDYDIAEWGWQHFEQRFLKMKLQRNILKDDRLDWSGYIKFIEKNKSLTKKNLIEEMLIKTPELFHEAQALVKLTPQPIVDRLLLWGAYTYEPMAVYLAEKLAMQTGQQIPHELALKVSKMLSHKRPLSEQFIQQCKQCLKIVGKIDREFIYAFDKEYEHILIRKRFVNHVQNKIRDPKFDHRDLQDLVTITPRQYLFEQDPKLYQQSIQSRAQLV